MQWLGILNRKDNQIKMIICPTCSEKIKNKMGLTVISDVATQITNGCSVCDRTVSSWLNENQLKFANES